MKTQEGKLRLYVEGTRRATWLETSGIPRLNKLSDIQSNDCVMLVGSQGRVSWSREESVHREDYNPWIMNLHAQRISSLSNSEIERRLRREGLPTQLGAVDPFSKPVTVTVWGMVAIQMRSQSMRSPKTGDRSQFTDRISERAMLTPEHSIWKPIERASVRALYVLGLDYGQVDVLYDNQGKLIITGISSRINGLESSGKQRLLEVMKAFELAWEVELEKGVQANLGADPEFILRSPEGRIVPASRFFSPDGEAGCDSVRIRGERRWPLVELRPRPSQEPANVTADMRRLLEIVSLRTAGVPLTWQAGALPVPGLPLGGHVHLSGLLLSGERLRALDNAVAVPLRLLEPSEAAKRRPRYGSLGDVRRQPHGGFEYRTPASWLVSPRLALGVLSLAKVAAEHSRELAFERPLDEEKYRDAFYVGDRTLLLEASDRIYDRIRNTTGYHVYRESIEFVFDAIRRNRSWDEAADIRVKWRIPIP